MCPYCKNIKVTQICNVNGYRIVRCNECSLAFTDIPPINVRKFNQETYNAAYINNYQLRGSLIKNRFREKLQLIERYKSGGALLDIGCSLGYFLQVVSESSRHKWKLFGAEINPKLVSLARRNVSADIKVSELPRLPFKDESFDVVTCFDVLEHSRSIKENIQEIKRVLKDDGIILIQSPNYMSLMQMLTLSRWDWWTPPDHAVHFTPSTLEKILNNAGFNVRYIKTYQYRADFLSNIKGVLFKPKFMKVLFYLLKPMLLLVDYITSKIKFGGLILLIAEKK